MPTNDREAAAGDDWAVHTADTIVSVVDAVRSKTTVPLTTVARGLVYGIIAGVMGTMALVLLAVALVRALDAYLPGDVWSAHAVTGGIFTLGGLFLWRKRRPPASSER
ncbi:MAG TPA: hypothetical protein VM030_07310 [Acidimicrobiales bacterium]|nr:hypothetical protein [Acidimicrobiales bacterium]